MRALILAVLAILGSVPPQDEGVALRFKYKAGDRESMQVEVTMNQAIKFDTGHLKLEQEQTGPVGFTMNAECKKAEEGATRLDLTFADVEVDQKFLLAKVNYAFKMKGKTIYVKDDNGNVLVDTENGIDQGAADPMLSEFAILTEKTKITLDERAEVKAGFKNRRLVRMLGGVSRDLLFPILLPKDAVKVGDEWTYVSKLQWVERSRLDKPLEVTLKLKLEGVEGEGDKRVATVSLKQEAEFKDVEGDGDLEGVGKAKISIKSLKLSGTAEARLNLATGRLVSSTAETKESMSLEMRPEGVGMVFKEEEQQTTGVKIAAK